MALCDVVILSNAFSPELKAYTRTAIKSLVNSEKAGTFDIYVCEQTEWKYNHVTTLHKPEKFNYNRFANEALSLGSSPWVCVSNNDVIFMKGWFTNLMKYKYDVMSPANPARMKQTRHKKNVEGLSLGTHFSGWCFVMKRNIWGRIGKFNEDFHFYEADRMVMNQLIEKGVKMWLIPESKVHHATGKTRIKLPAELHREITVKEVERYNKLYREK